jgi:hypothetical protein
VSAVADTGEPMRPPTRAVDFNRVIGWINLLLAAATGLVYLEVGQNDYLNGESIVLALLLAAQVQGALLIERRRRDPFVVLVCFILVTYYALRILTLLMVPFSFVLDRFEYLPADSNRALLFLLVANVFLFAGLFSRATPVDDPAWLRTWRPRSPGRVIFVVVMAMLVIYTRGAFWSTDSIPRALYFVVMFFAQAFIFLMSLTYFLVFRSTLSWRVRAALIGLLVLEMVLHTLSGSRSAIVGILQNILIVILAVSGTVRIPRRALVVGVLVSPVVAAILIGTFVLSTYTRTFTSTGGSSLATALEAVESAGDRLTTDYVLEAGLPVVLSRVGFFDYAAEVMAHREQYARVVNFGAYARSVTDNLLSPGFDLFDQPKISNSLRFVYEDLGVPSKTVSAEEYQSDQLGIYGELFVLFGWLSLPCFYLVGTLSKRIYASITDADPFLRTIKRVIVITLFVELINSFGMDWVLMDVIPFVVSLYLYRVFFPTRVASPVLTPG